MVGHIGNGSSQAAGCRRSQSGIRPNKQFSRHVAGEGMTCSRPDRVGLLRSQLARSGLDIGMPVLLQLGQAYHP